MSELPAGIQFAKIDVGIGPDFDRLLPCLAGKQQGEPVWTGLLPDRVTFPHNAARRRLLLASARSAKNAPAFLAMD